MKRHLSFALFAALALPSGAQAASSFTTLGQFPVGANPYGVIPADYNGDGRADVAVINGTSSTASFYLGQGDGTFVKEGADLLTDPPGLGGPNWGVARDFTGDGLVDLAVSNYVTSRVTVLQRLSTGGFQQVPAFTVPNATGIVSADFNGDGLPDLAASSEAGFVSVALRQVGGGFASEGSYGAGFQPRNLTTGDFNGDGRPDLAVVNEDSNNVTILIRNSQGTGFAAESTPVAIGNLPSHAASADFNGDGRIDVAVSNYGSSTVQLLLRNGSNSGFDVGPAVPIPSGPIGLVAADYDANGTPDLAVASNAGGTVTVLSGGTTPETTLTLERAYGVAAADFNGDGKPDLAASSDALNTFASFLNTTPGPQQPPPVQPPAPTPTPAPQLPEPVAGRNVNATPVKGSVKVKLPGGKSYVDLSQAQQLPVGTSVDTRKGTVEIKAAGNGGTAKFFDGIFKISQTKGKRPLTTLTLTEALSCPKGKKASASAKKKSRKLWGDGKGAFRTSGRYSAATVRGTKWLVTDRCDSTTTKVTQGSVTVRDFVKKRNKVVRAGKSYTARKR